MDERLWKQAQADNPDPENYIPVPIIGFSEVSLIHNIIYLKKNYIILTVLFCKKVSFYFYSCKTKITKFQS